VIAALETSRRKLGFLFLGYVVISPRRDAPMAPSSPLTISHVIQDIKWISARSLNRGRRASGADWQHEFCDRFVRSSFPPAQLDGGSFPPLLRPARRGYGGRAPWSFPRNLSSAKAGSGNLSVPACAGTAVAVSTATVALCGKDS
jgi:hypothetical protein